MPLAVDGFCATSALDERHRVVGESFSANETLPMRAWTMPAFSTRYSILPPLASLTALPTSNVTVPTLGFGIRPRGPRTRPSLPTAPIMSGVAMTRSKSMKPSWTLATRSSLPAKSAPASRASFSFSPLAKTSTRTVLPRSVREHERAADHLIGVLRIDAQAHRDIDRFVELGELRLLDESARLLDRVFARVVDDGVDLHAFLRRFRHCPPFRPFRVSHRPNRWC